MQKAILTVFTIFPMFFSGCGSEDKTTACTTKLTCSNQGICTSYGDSMICDCFQDRYTGDVCEQCASGYSWFNRVCALENQQMQSADRDYQWYKTQIGTGAHEINNCGPTSCAMAIKWFDQSKDIDPGSLRQEITGEKPGWWYTGDIESALTNYSIPFQVIAFDSIATLTSQIDQGRIIILCISMEYISYQSPPYASHFNKFYPNGTGHFIVVKGYIENGDWLDIYDPANNTYDYYADMTPYGKDRFYQGSEILTSAKRWWPYLIVIGDAQPQSFARPSIPEGRSAPMLDLAR